MYACGMGVQFTCLPFSDHNNRSCQKGGWGASCNKYKIQGRWTQEEASLHINILELKVALFALESFAKVYQMTNAHVRFKTDNIPAQAYINHQGGTKSVGLCNQAQELWKWCLLHQTSLCRASLKNSQPGCRPSFTHFQRSHRVDDKSTFPQRSIIITSSKPIDRPVCFSSEQTVSNLLQLETRSRHMEDRCLQFPMDTERPLCFPTILPGGKSSSKSHTRQVSEPSSCDTLVAFSTMVSPSEKFSHYTATISEGNKTNFSPSSIRESPPFMEAAEASCMGCLRRQTSELTLSKDVRDVLAQSVRPGTSSQYNSCWQYFVNWCISRETDPAEAPLSEVLEFLSHLFRERGLAYRTIKLLSFSDFFISCTNRWAKCR